MTKPTSGAIVSVTNLSAVYSNKTIWKQADFTINKGEFVAILGPNGAGKTTLFRLLLGLLKPSAGSINLFNSEPKRGNSRIGYVPQRRPINADLNIEALELIRLGISGERWGFASKKSAVDERALAKKALSSVDAIALAHRSLGSLSGGELQRVFLAQALVGSVDLLLLDEPLANLDIRRQTELVGVINKVVRSKGVTVLLIAHDLNPLLPVLDRVIYIAGGKVATGTPAEIVTSKSLSALYGAPIEVVRDSRGRVAVFGTEEVAHHE